MPTPKTYRFVGCRERGGITETRKHFFLANAYKCNRLLKLVVG
jgi:hypothetical protein